MTSRFLLPPAAASAVLDYVDAGADVIVPVANGEPPALLDALEAGADALSGVRVHQMHALEERPYIRGELGDRLRHVSYFLSAATRPAYWAGQVDLVPNPSPRSLPFSDGPPAARWCWPGSRPSIVTAISAWAPTPTTPPA